MDNIIEEMSDFAIKYFKISKHELYDRNREGNKVIARHLLWYVLHVDYNVSTGVLSKEFMRSRRNIFISISKIRHWIKTQRFYKDMYNHFISSFRKE